MKTSPQGIAALIGHEGIVPGPYLDSVGVWTVFVGHTAAAGAPDPATMPRGTPADVDGAIVQALRQFAVDLGRYEADVLRAVKVPMQQHEFDALVSFHFNTGAISRAQIIKRLNAGYRLKAGAAFMGWKKPASIIDRRTAEQLLFTRGIYPTGKLTVWGVSNTGRVIWTPLKRITAGEAIAMMATGFVDQETIKQNTVLKQDVTLTLRDNPVTHQEKPSFIARLIAWLFGKGA
jgi:lysozyme